MAKTKDALKIIDQMVGDDATLRRMIAEESVNATVAQMIYEARTDAGAEEEIRLVFGKIGELMLAEAPALFSDYTVTDGTWVPGWRKV